MYKPYLQYLYLVAGQWERSPISSEMSDAYWLSVILEINLYLFIYKIHCSTKDSENTLQKHTHRWSLNVVKNDTEQTTKVSFLSNNCQNHFYPFQDRTRRKWGDPTKYNFAESKWGGHGKTVATDWEFAQIWTLRWLWATNSSLRKF